MTGHCPCKATGLSSHAIAHEFGHCHAGGTDHPHDPSDFLRCVNYIRLTGPLDLTRMTTVSSEWAVLVSHWTELCDLLNSELGNVSRMAPKTYKRMRELLDPVREARVRANL